MRRPAIVFAAAVGLYLPTIGFGFVQDDRAIIARNPAVHSIGAALRAFDEPYWPRPNPGGLYRPLAITSFALDWTVSRGSAAWMHLMNALLHGLVSVLVVLVLSRWLPGPGAVAAGLVFALHPVHVEGVASLVSRAELLVAAGMLGAVLAARRRVWWGAVGCAALAMLSKEHGVITSVVILLDDWLESGGRPAYPLALYVSLSALTAGYLALWASVGRTALGDMAPAFLGAGTGARLAIALPAVWRAAVLLVWPADLSADYNPQVIPVRDGVSLEAALGVAVIAGVAALAWRARRGPRELAFAAAVAALALLPTSNLLFASGVVLAERALYLPVLLPAVGVGLLALRVRDRATPRAAMVLVGVLCVLLAWRSYARLPAWRDNKALLTTLLEEHPESYRAHVSAAAVLAGMGDTAGARREYERADSLFPGDPHLAAARAFFLLAHGDTAEAARLVARGRVLMPNEQILLRSAFLLALRRGDSAGALAVGDSAVRRYPWEVEWYRIEFQRLMDSLRTAR